jgi:hypothetical protein
MSKVYVVQKPLKVIKDGSGAVVDTIPLFNLTPAMEFGELVVLFDPGDVSLMPERVMSILHDKMVDFCDEDYILPTGDTVLVAAASMKASERNDGSFKILKWDRACRSYTELQYDL